MPRPNILLITSDQQHWNTLGCINPEVKTPALDRLCAEGTRFNRAYCPNPTCTPTRSSMITGKYPSQHGACSLGMKLPEDEPTVGAILQQAGYQTALVGKAHFQQLKNDPQYPSLESYPILQDLDFWADFDQDFYGFQHVELARNHTDEAHVGQHYALWMEEMGLENWRDYFRPPTGNNANQHHKWLIPEEFHYNAWIAQRSCALMEDYQASEKPFFLWASFFDPHPDYLVPEPWDTMYDPAQLTIPAVLEGEHKNNPLHFQMTQTPNPDFSAWKEQDGNAMHGLGSHLHDCDALAKDIAVYYGMISCMDKYIGQIVDKLDALRLAENTLVVFTSDHGHYYGHHGLIAKGPFHYEDGVRVPLIVRMPGHVPQGDVSEALQSLVDITPSFLSVAGVDVPEDMTGVDASGVWFDTQDSHRTEIIVENHHQPTTIHMRTYVDDRYKFTVYNHQLYGELFDLQEDPGEHHNLWNAPEHQALKAELTLKLLLAEIHKEEKLTETTRHLPQKNEAAQIKTFADGGWEITVDPAWSHFSLHHSDYTKGHKQSVNLWDDTQYAGIQAQMVTGLLFARLDGEKFWMPRVGGA